MTNLRKISFNFLIDDDIDLEDLRETVRDILHQSSDYWHDNIASYVDKVTGELVVNTYPGDFKDIRRSRQYLKEAFGLVVDTVT